MFAWRIKEQKVEELSLKRDQLKQRIKKCEASYDEALTRSNPSDTSSIYMRGYYSGMISVLEESLTEVEDELAYLNPEDDNE